MSNHTPTPWEVGTRRPYIVARTNPETDTSRDQFYVSSGTPTGGSGWPVITYDERAANAARIVACVNALAARNPARLGDVEKAIDEVLETIEFETIEPDGCFTRINTTHLEQSVAKLTAALAAFRAPVAKAKEAN